ncbi:unnamed protein product [Caenorhabditis brenneri]
MAPKTAANSKITATEVFDHAVISIENYKETQTWFLVLIGVLVLLTSVLCGLWCLLAAKNVKEDGRIQFDDDDDRDKSKGSRSTAGSDFSVVEMEKEEVKETGGIKNYLTEVGKSLVFMK